MTYLFTTKIKKRYEDVNGYYCVDCNYSCQNGCEGSCTGTCEATCLSSCGENCVRVSK